MRSTKLQFLHENGRAEMYKGYKKTYYTFLSRTPTKQSQIECILLLTVGTERQSDCYV